jgi:hypothetical protein
MFSKQLDRLNNRHWRYNSEASKQFYADHRTTATKVYETAGENVPFREIIDDPNIRYMEKERYRQLAIKANDIGEMLRQTDFGSPTYVNPYYDNSIASRLSEDRLMANDTYRQLDEARQQYDESIDRRTLKTAGNMILDNNTYANHQWFEDR